MENDELIKKENDNEFDHEEDQNSVDQMDSNQKILDETSIEVDQNQNAENLLESGQTFPEESVVEDEELLEPPLDQPSEPAPPPQKKEVKRMPGWLRTGLIYAGVGILLLLAGYLIAFFTTTVPAQNSYQSVLQDLNNKETELNELQTKFDQVNDVLTETKSEFDRLNQDYQSLELDHNQLLSNSEFNQNLIDFKYEIGRAKFALLNEDRVSANLAISLAKDKLEKIQILLGSDISTGMSDQLQEIQKLVRTNPEKALDQLRTLNENLERIPFK